MASQEAFNTHRNGKEPRLNGVNGVNGSHVADFPISSIAIVGMSGRFGGEATSPSKLWELCRDGKDGWSTIPGDRFDIKSLFHPTPSRLGRNHVKGGYFFKEDVALFDAAFFNFPADVASAMDPQIRIMMESVYEAFENAGIPIESLGGSNTSVYAGIFGRDYFDTQISDSEILPRPFITGNGSAMLSNRVSHFFDLRGPSMTIDTGCSTGMVAVHQACRSIQSGDSDIAVVGASAVLLNPDIVLSSEGRCYAWDDRASGYGRGEGVSTLILKRLDAAQKDGDFIHAVIRDSGSGQDGKTPTISSPSMEAQLSLIRECYNRAGLDISETSYVEAHMTGTPTGDPIEAEALAKSFGAQRKVNDPVIVGSVKTNVGHTEPTSGLAAIIKTAYILQNGLIPPNLNYNNTNPKIPLANWNLKVPTVLTPWPQDKPMRASINNFGYGGSNTHIILERAPDKARPNGYHSGHLENSEPSRVYVVSSKDNLATQNASKKLAAYIRSSVSEGKDISPADLAFTLAERKSRFPRAVALKAKNLEELACLLEDPKLKVTRALRNTRLGFVFNGQGAQWHAMGRELISAYPVFGSAIQRAEAVLRQYGAEWSLSEELTRDAKTTRVHAIDLSQPITVALQMALVDLLASWGIAPSAVTSHSSGEIAAAYSVGALSFEEALGVVYFRGKHALKHHLIKPMKGSMLAAGISPEKAAEYIKDTANGVVVIACVNSPDGVTLSGDTLAVREVASRLEKDGLFARELKVPMAYHSHHMENMAPDYLESLAAILPQTRTWAGAIFSSPVTGNILASPEALGPEHWVENLTSPVLFSQAFENMCFSTNSLLEMVQPSKVSNVDIIIEIGAHGTLSGPIRQILKDRKLPYFSCLTRSVNAVDSMHGLACELTVLGYPVILGAVNSPLDSRPSRYVHDLPTYSWNHTIRYWNEPRKYLEHRNRRFQPHELLGSPIAGSNRRTPTWRTFLTLAEVPWLSDHQIEGKAVLPGAGYIAMAIEAVRLVTDATETSIRGYSLRDIEILNALTIMDSPTGVEIQFSLRPCSEKELEYQGWYEFDVCSVGEEGSWVEHCKGFVSAETVAKNQAGLDKLETKWPHSKYFFAPGLKVKDVDPESVFAGLREMTLEHGPAFQNLISSRVAADKAITTFNIASAVTPIASDINEAYVVHPTTLDSIFQAFYVCIPEKTKENALVVPRSIRSIFVPKDIERKAGQKLRAFTELVKSDRRGAVSKAIIASATQEEPSSFLSIEGFYTQGIPREALDGDESKLTRLCAKSTWEPDVLHCLPSGLRDSWISSLSDADLAFEKNLRRAAFHLIHDAVLQLEGKQTLTWQPHQVLLYNWMKTVVEEGLSNKLTASSKSWAKSSKGIKQKIFDNLASTNAAGALVFRVGSSLVEIIQGEVSPLDLMVDNDLLHRYYQEAPARKRTFEHLKNTIELYAAKYPGANVLEIGAGVGVVTAFALDGFATKSTRGSGSLLGHYDFTDSSDESFEDAKQKLGSWGSLIDFKKLDINLDPNGQSFLPGSYDLIISSLPLPRMKDLVRVLENIRRLLKPLGKLILLETTQDRISTHLLFGTLYGPALSERETDLKISPTLSTSKWDKILKSTGFTGVEIEVGDCENLEFQSESVLVSTAASETTHPQLATIVYTDSYPPQTWTNELVQSISANIGAVTTIQSLEELDVKDDTLYIFTPEMTKPFLDTLDKPSFEKLKKVLVDGLGVLWLSCSSTIDAAEPLYAQAQGLFRTMKQEDSSKRYVQLDFDVSREAWSSDKIGHICHVLKQSFNYSVESDNIEWEYAVKDSVLYVPRLYPDVIHDQLSSEVKASSSPELEPFLQPGRDLVWAPSSSGLLSDLHFTDQAELELPDGFVELESKAYGLNFRDVMLALNQLDETLLGHDCAGIITRMGPHTESSGLRVGDRVAGVCQGRFATKTRVAYTTVTEIPDNMSWEEAASLPLVYITAYIALVEISRLQRGESVLIHAATGGTGQAAVMLAQHIGAEVFVTCGTDVKREYLIERYGIAPDHIYSSRDKSFAPAIMSKTNGKGVDVVLNSLAGPLLKATWECIARFGRFLEIGKIDMEAAKLLDLSPLTRCATMNGIDILQYIEYRGSVVQNALASIIRLCADNTSGVKPVYPLTPYPISDLEKAMRIMQRGQHMGKIVIVPGTGDQVKVVSPNLETSLDSADSTYLIVGGLGGIGRAMALWMIEKGAKHILLVSRSAASHPEAASLSRRAKDNGCNLHIRSCDVSDEVSLVALLANCAHSMPPVRGVIQAAMHLNDTVLERMSYDQWYRGITPKVAGTRNLDKHLTDLKFFIMLSSVSGVIGNVSQSNYAAGNTYQDGLARYRTSKGLPAVSIDLGPVSDVGVLAESNAAELDRVEKSLGSTSISSAQLLRLIEASIRDPLKRTLDDSQIITCVADWANIPEGVPIKKDKRFGTLRLGDSRATSALPAAAASGGGRLEELINTMATARTAPQNLTAEQGSAVATELMVNKMSLLFSVDSSEFEASLPLAHYGVDSLLAVELRNWLSAAVKAKVTIFEILQTASLTDFATLIARRCGLILEA
ncbi:hypothetical protein BUE80_DR003887 [Diplocarpon rosae]|nr:hypothetical protein BUE80_DR003887 [Diplocarpon rosae]